MADLTRAIGETFVRNYFRTLLESPHLTHQYYRDACVLTRPDANGDMTSVTTKQAMNDLILSLDFRRYYTQIRSTDAQRSLDGIMLLVTGDLIRKEDQLQRKFVQSFFLAPQPTGFYVRNDIFRYVDEDVSLVQQSFPGTVNGTVESSIADNISSEPEPTLVSQHTVVNPATSVNTKRLDRELEVDNFVKNEEESVVTAEVVADGHKKSYVWGDLSITEMATSDENGPKKSYVAYVNVMNGGSSAHAVYVLVDKAKDASWNTEQQQVDSEAAAPQPEASACISKNASTASDSHDEVQCHKIYIPKLPLDVSISEIKEGLQKFGSIKPGGVQVRTNTFWQCCFSYVEFEALSSMTSALEERNVTIAGCHAVIKPYNYQPRAVRGRGLFTPKSWSGRGSGRSQFSNQGGFRRGSYGHSGEGYQ